MFGGKLSRYILVLLALTIVLLGVYNYHLVRKYEIIDKNMFFFEYDSVIIKVSKLIYAGGEFYPEYYYIEEVLYSDFNNSNKLLGKEIMADFIDKDSYIINCDHENNKFIFYGQLKKNNYHMFKIIVSRRDNILDKEPEKQLQ